MNQRAPEERTERRKDGEAEGRWVNQRAPEERTERRKDGEAEEGEDGNCAAMPSRGNERKEERWGGELCRDAIAGNERKEERWGGAGILQNVGFWSEKLTK